MAAALRYPKRTRYTEVHLRKALAFIAAEQIKADWQPVPIAASKAAERLGCGERTWRYDVRQLVDRGWIERKVRSGKVKGFGRNGYNPGSMYRVNWEQAPMAGFPRSKTGNGQLVSGNGWAEAELRNRQWMGLSRQAARVGFPAKRDPSPPIGGGSRAAAPALADSGLASRRADDEISSPQPLSGTPPPVEVSAQVAALFSRGGSPNGCG